MNADELGKLNYDTYCGTRDWKSFNGDPLPQWPDVKLDIKNGWITAASAVAAKVECNCYEPGRITGNLDGDPCPVHG